jgi:carotenoid cleavage dioxygenase-like enzyme
MNTSPPTLYLQGEHEPIATELPERPLTVSGELPRGLNGLYVRNSPNPQFQPLGRYHWFDGDGMVHGLRFAEGNASYLNRWIRTRAFEHEREAGHTLWRGILEPMSKEALALPGGPLKDTANTDLVFHQQRLYALWWLSGTPYELSTKDLSTVGPQTFGERLGGGMSAHPKVDPRTGELCFFDYSIVKQPSLRYGVVSAQGELLHVENLELPAPHILHDMAITEHYSLLLDFPMGWDTSRLKLDGKRRIGFNRELPARIGVIPRHGRASEVKWFEAESCYVYHSINAYEAGDDIVLTACRVRDPIPEQQETSGKVARLDNIELVPTLYEWRMNLKTGRLTERQLDDRATEFPRINDGIQGTRATYSYNPRIAPRADLTFDGVVKYELATGAVKAEWNAPRGWFIGEPSFAPAPGATREDHGWLITWGTNAAEGVSAAFVIDATECKTVATLQLPQRIPLGFHSYWCPAS